jgi:hypothetical protein
MADENSILSRRVLSNPNANRPAETDVARVQWIATEADGQLLIDDTTFISTASAVPMDAADYRGQTANDVLNDCAQASGKNFYAFYNETIGGSGLWYGAEDLTTHNSMIRLTNVLGEVDNTLTFAISEDTRLVRDPSRTLSGAYYQYATSAVYVRNQAMFQYIGLRDMPFSSTNVKTLAKATARANRYLLDNDSEDDRITTTVILPAAKVNWIKAGHRIPFKATHLPGYEDYVFLRVYRRSVVQISEQHYALTLELGTGSVPPSPTAEPASSSLLSFSGHIGSAVFLGLPADREHHWATDVGGNVVTLTPGRQYRLVCTITFNRTSINPDAKTNSFSVEINIAAGSGTRVNTGAGYIWASSGTNTATMSYEGSSGPMWGLTNLGRDTLMDAGSIITGDWITFTGPTLTTADISIGGIAFIGFHGFELIATLDLQERNAP